MEYLYRIEPTRPAMVIDGPTLQEREIISQHFAYLSRLKDDGVVILVGRTQENNEKTFGICVFNADSEEAAQGIMNNDPAVKNGVMRATLHPYRVALIAEANVKQE
jgi:uncharacterized protein YciI